MRVDDNGVQTAIYVNLGNARKTRGGGCLRTCALGSNYEFSPHFEIEVTTPTPHYGRKARREGVVGGVGALE